MTTHAPLSLTPTSTMRTAYALRRIATRTACLACLCLCIALYVPAIATPAYWATAILATVTAILAADAYAHLCRAT